MIRQTTIQAWQSLEPLKLGERQLQVVKALRIRPMTNLELSQFLGLPINCVTPRVNELYKAGVIIEQGVKRQITGRNAIVWELKN